MSRLKFHSEAAGTQFPKVVSQRHNLYPSKTVFCIMALKTISLKEAVLFQVETNCQTSGQVKKVLSFAQKSANV